MSIERQKVSVHCLCGQTHTVTVTHYQVVYLPCGKKYWTLQPKRDGTYILKPWPGKKLTRQEMKLLEKKP